MGVFSLVEKIVIFWLGWWGDFGLERLCFGFIMVIFKVFRDGEIVYFV